jgi:hypothetical protein
MLLTAGLACSTRQSSPLDDKTWISPGKVQISNFQPGKNISQKITIHNGNKLATQFAVYYRIPDYVESGYSSAPTDAPSWVAIENPNPILTSGEVKEILVKLKLHSAAVTPSRWEFWIGVREAKANSLTAELCTRWLITMASPAPRSSANAMENYYGC